MSYADRCVCCGEIVPEGRMVCWACEHQADNEKHTKGIGGGETWQNPQRPQDIYLTKPSN